MARIFASLRCAGLHSAHASLNTGLVLHVLMFFRWLFLFFVFVLAVLLVVAVVVVVVVVVCHRFAPLLISDYPKLDSLVFAPHTFYTQNLMNAVFPKAFLNMAFSQNPTLHKCVSLNFIRGLNKTNVFASKPSFPQNPFYTIAVLYAKNTGFGQKPCSCWACAWRLFAAIAWIALSMVARVFHSEGGQRKTNVLQL